MKQRENQHLLERLVALGYATGDPSNPRTPALRSRLENAIGQLETPTKLVVAGMAGSGHHALADLLLGADLFKETSEAAACPRVTIRHSQMPMSHALRGKNRMSFAGLSVKTALAGSMPDSIEFEMPNAELADVEYTILPECEEDGCRTGVLIDLLQRAQIIIWCSDATRPWHADEHTIWSNIPDEMRQQSILALTNTDTDDATQTLLDEKSAMLGKTFRHVSPITITAAKAAAPGGLIRDTMAFASSGAQSLFCQVRAHVALTREPILEEARALMSEIDTAPAKVLPPKTAASVAPVPLVTVKPTPTSPVAVQKLRGVLLEGARHCILLTADPNSVDLPKLFDAMDKMLSDLLTIVQGELRLDRDHDLILEQLEEACELVGLLSFDGADTAAAEAADILQQITSDVWHRLPAAMADTPAKNEKVSATA